MYPNAKSRTQNENQLHAYIQLLGRFNKQVHSLSHAYPPNAPILSLYANNPQLSLRIAHVPTLNDRGNIPGHFLAPILHPHTWETDEPWGKCDDSEIHVGGSAG